MRDLIRDEYFSPLNKKLKYRTHPKKTLIFLLREICKNCQKSQEQFLLEINKIPTPNNV
jgi:hypothetical protein